MSNLEWELLLTLAISLVAFVGLGLIESACKTGLSPGLRKYLWFFFILKFVLPVGLVSPLILNPVPTSPVSDLKPLGDQMSAMTTILPTYTLKGSGVSAVIESPEIDLRWLLFGIIIYIYTPKNTTIPLSRISSV